MTLEQGEDGDREHFDNLYRNLQEPQRRRLLFSLLEHNPRDALIVPEDVHVGESEVEDLNLALVHQHLPMLEKAGLIRWDREADEVHKGPLFAEVKDVLEAIDEYDPITTEE